MFDIAVGMLGTPSFIYYLASSVGGISNCFAASLARCLIHAPIQGSSITVTAMTLAGKIHCYLTSFYLQNSSDQKSSFKFRKWHVTVEFLVIILSFKSRWFLQIYIILKVTLVFFITAFVYTRIYLVVKNRAEKKPNDAAAGMNLTKRKVFLQELRQARSCFIVVVCFFALIVSCHQ